MQPSDAGHRPHAIHTGQKPKFSISRGPESIRVNLDTWGPSKNLFSTMWNELQSNWGENPEHVPNDESLTEAQWEYVEKCFGGKTLPQVLESIGFMFTIDGISRACTHQLVRTRIGAAMMQHGGRDNDWRHRNWTMPETLQRICMILDPNESTKLEEAELKSCLTDAAPIYEYLKKWYNGNSVSLEHAVMDYLNQGHELYAALVDAGVPWQDARRLLHMGTQTYIHINYNYVALRDVLANRLEHVMDWEINCVAQLMLRELKMKCPPIFSKHLGSHSDRAKKAMFAGLESWHPDGKYPVSEEPGDRTHRVIQNPFWVLSPRAMEGGEIEWIPTNGTYPHGKVDGVKFQTENGKETVNGND